MEENVKNSQIEDKPKKMTVLDADDIMDMVPKLKGHRKLVEWFIRFLELDKVNDIHVHNASTPGPQFVHGLLNDLDIKLKIDNAQVLDNLPQGAFVTVSNHHFGAQARIQSDGQYVLELHMGDAS